jgi:hypothetical protein
MPQLLDATVKAPKVPFVFEKNFGVKIRTEVNMS